MCWVYLLPPQPPLWRRPKAASLYGGWGGSKYSKSMNYNNLEIIKTIYHQDYWRRGKCDEIPPHLRHIYFDMCINFGRGGAVRVLQRQRNKICSALLFPGPWQQSGFVLKDTLELLKIPYITISLGEDVTLLKGTDNIGGDILKACETALEQLTQLIELN